MLTEEQHALRRSGIGGSEIGAILGESPFASPFDVWLAKTEGWRQPETVDLERGRYLEDGVVAWYESRAGVESSRQGQTTRHATRHVAICTPDLLTRVHPEAPWRLVSIKCPRRKTSEWGDPGTDDVPTPYALQLQWEHLVMSSHEAIDSTMHLVALLDGDLAVYEIQADLELQGWLIDCAEEWWRRHVVEGVPPPLDGSRQAKAWLKSKHPLDSGQEREATPHEARLMVELEMAEEEAERHEEESEALRLQLRMQMGATSVLRGPNGVVTWKTDKRGQKAFRTKWRER